MTGIYRDANLRSNKIHIDELLLMISILLGCRSVFVQANPYFGYILLSITATMSIVAVTMRKGAKLNSKSILVFFGYLLIAMVVTLTVTNTSNGPFIFSYWVLVPLMLFFFLLLTYQEKMDWLKHFSDVIFIFTVLSTISWLIGPIMNLIQPTHTIDLFWGKLTRYDGYFFCYVRPEIKLKSFLGIALPDNNSIYVEAPITNVIFSLGYILNSFVKKDKSKVKEAVFIISLFSTMSTSAMLIAVVIFSIGRILAYKENPSKGSLHFFITRLVLPIVFLIFACFAVSFILDMKRDNDYGNYYAHTFALKSGFDAWLTKPFSGYGYELGQQFYNTTSGFFKVLVHGGIIFVLLYIVPFVASVRFAIKEKDFGLLMFLGSSFVLLILVIWHYSPAYMFILAFEYSFMGKDNSIKTQEIEHN